MTVQGTGSKLTGADAMFLAIGVVVLEFATAVATFVSGTLLPIIEQALSAQDHLPALVSGSSIGMFTALPLASLIISWFRPARVLTVGLLLAVVGATLSVTAVAVWIFAIGQFVSGFAGAVLAVYGVGATIRLLEETLRLKVIAVMSAMWILPALVGPPVTLALEHVANWRVALLVPVPLLILGRLLVVRAVPPAASTEPAERPLGITLLVPAGVAAFVLLSSSTLWLLAPVALVVATVGFLALMPAGTGRLTPGPPAALAGLTLFGVGYFGANSLVTIMFTAAYGTSIRQAGIALSAAPIAWAVASLLVPKVRPAGLPPALGLTLTSAGLAIVGACAFTGGSWLVPLAAWTLSGLGVGLAYPSLFLRATTESAAYTATMLATAAIVTEAFGGLLGSAAGAGLASTGGQLGLTRPDALGLAYVAFAAVTCCAALAAARSATPNQVATTSEP